MKALREQLVETLELLAFRQVARSYQQNVPIANVPAELFCRWFDDAYHPDSEAFTSEFTPSELEAMARFNKTFEAVSDEVGEDLPELEVLLNSPSWGKVTASAADTLKTLGVVAQQGVPADGIRPAGSSRR